MIPIKLLQLKTKLKQAISILTTSHNRESKALAKIANELNTLKKEIKQQERTNYQQLQCYLELRRAMPGEGIIPPLRGYAASPDLLLYLQETLAKYRPKYILELGSGFSSVALAKYAADNDFIAISIDHEQEYANKTARLIDSWGLSSHHKLLIAPLIEYDSILFYDTEPIEKCEQRYDFVFLDGPPQKFGKKVRGGLLPLLKNKLSEECLILLDDYYRPGEQQIVKEWIEAGYADIIEINTQLEKHSALLRVKK